MVAKVRSYEVDTSGSTLIDPINLRLLAALQADARLSTAELARQVSLSAPAVAERVRRLE